MNGNTTYMSEWCSWSIQISKRSSVVYMCGGRKCDSEEAEKYGWCREGEGRDGMGQGGEVGVRAGKGEGCRRERGEG